VRMHSKDGLVPRAFPRPILGEPLVRLRCGALWFSLSCDEATALATDLVNAVEALEADQRQEVPDGRR
jgi:hypothetical protein